MFFYDSFLSLMVNSLGPQKGGQQRKIGRWMEEGGWVLGRGDATGRVWGWVEMQGHGSKWDGKAGQQDIETRMGTECG